MALNLAVRSHISCASITEKTFIEELFQNKAVQYMQCIFLSEGGIVQVAAFFQGFDQGDDSWVRNIMEFCVKSGYALTSGYYFLDCLYCGIIGYFTGEVSFKQAALEIPANSEASHVVVKGAYSASQPLAGETKVRFAVSFMNGNTHNLHEFQIVVPVDHSISEQTPVAAEPATDADIPVIRIADQHCYGFGHSFNVQTSQFKPQLCHEAGCSICKPTL